MISDCIALFGAGVASFLAPCIVPLVPAYLGMVAGESAAARDTTRAVPATLVFVAGFAAVFTALGAAAGALGRTLSPVEGAVQRAGGALVLVFGLVMLGVIRGPFTRERRLSPDVLPRAGRLRPFVIGVAFGAAWSPCVGPLLGAALVVAAQSGEVLRGALYLLSYAAGIGVPFVIASLGLASSPGAANRLRGAGPKIERVAGVLLVALGLLLVTGAYRHLTSYLARFTPAVGGL